MLELHAAAFAGVRGIEVPIGAGTGEGVAIDYVAVRTPGRKPVSGRAMESRRWASTG